MKSQEQRDSLRAPGGGEAAPPAGTCPAPGARAAGRSVQNWVEGRGGRSGWCWRGGRSERSDLLTAFFLKGRGAGKRRKARGGGVASGSCLLPASSPGQRAGARGEPNAGLSKSACFFRSPKSRNPGMSLSGTSPRGGAGGKRQTRVLFADPFGLKQTSTPQGGGVNREGGLGGRKWAERQAAGGQDHRCSDPPAPPRVRPGPEQGAGMPGSKGPSPEPGGFHHPASETRRRRRFPAPGLPEGGASEREALAAASLSSVKSGTEGQPSVLSPVGVHGLGTSPSIWTHLA